MKTTQILKAMPVGVLAGAAIFFIPFPFRFFFGFLLIFFAFRFFPGGRWRRNYGYNNFNSHYFWNPSYTQRWQNMSKDSFYCAAFTDTFCQFL